MESNFHGIIHLTYFRYLFEEEMNNFPKDYYFFFLNRRRKSKTTNSDIGVNNADVFILSDECCPGYHVYRKKQSQHPV